MSEAAPSQATTEIYKWVEDKLGRKEVGTANRASSAPGCVLKRWYQNNGIEGEALNARMILVFGLGDLVEHWYKNLIEESCVGPGKLYSEVDFGEKTGVFIVQHRTFNTYKQEQLTIKLKNLPVITGSPDGWGKRNSDGKWELIEIKSSADYGFDNFLAGETPNYIYQVHALMMSDKATRLGVKEARFFYMKKSTSHIFDRLYHFDDETARQTAIGFALSNGKEAPPRPYEPTVETYYKKPTGRLVLGYPCSYCDYKLKCFPKAQLEFKSGKPIYVIPKSEDQNEPKTTKTQ